MWNARAMYEGGLYQEHNADWHVEDSSWKAEQVFRMIQQHRLEPRTVFEIGCGAGEILLRLRDRMPGVSFTGYEIAPYAFELCKKRSGERLDFVHGDLLSTGARADLMLCIDVLEHIPDYLDFLARLRGHAVHHIFHIPLDLSLLSVLRPDKLVEGRYSIGHLHWFSRETALAVLRDSGYEVIDHVLTAGALELTRHRRRFRSALAFAPRWVVSRVDRRLAARLFGGFSLLVLAKAQ